MKLGLEDKVVVVTGGTKGIGRAIVEAFLTEGARVYFCSRTATDVAAATQALQPATAEANGHVYGSVIDVTDPRAIELWINSISSAESRIDVVVANVSSISTANTAASWTTAFQTDMLGTVELVNQALPQLEAAHGNIIAISSVSGRDVDFTAPGPYGAFKAALVHYMAQLARTLAPKGVRANTVSPGNIFVENGVWDAIRRDNPALYEAQLAKNPMGRFGKAQEVADAVLFLASQRAAFISGTNLVVDGALCTGVQL